MFISFWNWTFVENKSGKDSVQAQQEDLHISVLKIQGIISEHTNWFSTWILMSDENLNEIAKPQA